MRSPSWRAASGGSASGRIQRCLRGGNLPPGDDYLAGVEATLANRAVVVAFADEWKLITWHTIDAGEEGPRGIVKRFMKRWGSSLREQEERKAEVETLRELIDA